MRSSTTLSGCVSTKVDAEEGIEKAVPLKHLYPMGLV